MAKPLTDRYVQTKKVDPEKDTMVSDGDGLYLRVTPAGGKAFLFRYQYAGRRKWMTLGAYPDLSLARARELRAEKARILVEGKDPGLQQKIQVTAKKAAPTVQKLGEEFHDNWLKVHYLQPKDAYDRLKRDPIRLLGTMLVTDVEPHHIQNVLNEMVVERGALVAANRTLRLMRLMFDYAKVQSYITANPVTMTPKAAGGRERSKTTQLQLNQLQHVLSVLNDPAAAMATETRLAIKLIMATAKRPMEVATIERQHLQLDQDTWVNPKELTKEKHDDHTVFLSRYAVWVINQLLALHPDSAYLLPSPRGAERDHPIDRHSLSKAILRLYKEGVIKVKFTPHDLRRTFSSRMADLGVLPHVVEKCLDHLMTGTMAVYNKASYYPERKAAMKLWGKTLEGLDPEFSVSSD